MSLQLGDRVRTAKGFFAGVPIKKDNLGTVVYLPPKANDGYTGIQFDQKIPDGHECSGMAPNFPIFKDGHCRWGYDKELVFIEHGEPIPPVFLGWKNTRKKFELWPVPKLKDGEEVM